ncbi:MAG: ABC transporter permease [Chthoniobacterales bacterium]
MLTDFKYALRTLLKTPGFTVIAVLTLALGIGANSAIFSVVNAVLLKPPQYKNPEQLVWIWATRKGVSRAFYSIPNFNDTRAQSQSVSEWIALSPWGVNLLGPNETERLQGIRLSGGALQNLGVNAATGRIFTADDEKPASARVVMLSYGVWQRRFGGDAKAIGTTLTLNGDSYTIVGVLPRAAVIPNTEVDLVAPLNLETDARRSERGTNFLRLMARLKPGVTLAQAQAELTAITDRLRDQFPNDNGNVTPPRVLPLQDEIVGEYRQVLIVLFGAVIAVLMIACSNLANLQLARASARHREIAIRSALGATRWHLLRQLLSEGLLLAMCGGALGLLLATWGKDALVRLAPPDFPHAASITIDGPVLAFCLGVTLLAGVILGLVPAFRAASADVNADLKSGSPAAGVDRARGRARNALIVAEVAMSLVLLICAGLLIKSFARLQRVNPGFDYERALAVRLALPPAKYSDGNAAKLFYDRLAARLQTIPGLDSIGAISALPMSGLNARTTFEISGHPAARPMDSPFAQHRWVTPGYFQTMHMPLRAGRDFTDQDRNGGAGVVIIDEALALRYFPDADPVGQHIRVTLGDTTSDRGFEIVGVVPSVKHNTLTEEPVPTFYGPMPQIPKPVAGFLANNFSLVVRTNIDAQAFAESVRRELRASDPDVAVSSVKPIDQIVAASIASRRFNLILLAAFAATALLLAAGGIYAVIAFLVTTRTREIGVRLALGAQRGDVLHLVIGHALKLVSVGVIFGLAGAIAATRAIASLLYSTSATDPVTYGGVAALLIVFALLASYLPARRAMNVDPMVALRYE